MKQTKNRDRNVKITVSSLFAILVFAFTMILKIPTPQGGYLNPGDAAVLLAGWLLGPTYGFFAAAIGSAIADLFLGYGIYVGATFLIKGAMAVMAYAISQALLRFYRGRHITTPFTISGILSECFMVGSYYLFEAIVCGYGFIGALTGISGNILQGVTSIILGVLAYVVLREAGVIDRYIEKHRFIGKE